MLTPSFRKGDSSNRTDHIVLQKGLSPFAFLVPYLVFVSCWFSLNPKKYILFPNWIMKVAYARLVNFISEPPALQSVPVRQSSFSALNTTNSPALRAKAGLGGYPPGIELGGSGRVAPAAEQTAKRNPALLFSVEKTKATCRGYIMRALVCRHRSQNQPEAKKSPRLFSEDGKKRRGE